MKSLQFNVAQLLKEPIGATRMYELDDDIAEISQDVQALGPLRGTITFIRTNDGILATGTLTTVVKLLCSRCVEDYLTKVEFELEETFYPSFDINTGYKISKEALLDVDPATLIDELNMLDLTEVLRQDLLLAVPPYPICRPDCAGICPHCGQDLNDGPCNCVEQEINPSWTRLQALLESKNE